MKLPKLGDYCAIPSFAWLLYYFYKKKTKTPEEEFLQLFCFAALFIDVYFVSFEQY
jgi:hypothetical protein